MLNLERFCPSKFFGCCLSKFLFKLSCLLSEKVRELTFPNSKIISAHTLLTSFVDFYCTKIVEEPPFLLANLGQSLAHAKISAARAAPAMNQNIFSQKSILVSQNFAVSRLQFNPFMPSVSKMGHLI